MLDQFPSIPSEHAGEREQRNSANHEPTREHFNFVTGNLGKLGRVVNDFA
jgi:hypothetical protein